MANRNSAVICLRDIQQIEAKKSVQGKQVLVTWKERNVVIFFENALAKRADGIKNIVSLIQMANKCGLLL